jgi:transketolase
MIQDIDIRDAFFDELYDIAGKDNTVIFMTADMGAFSLERFRHDYPSRFINVGISEQNLVSVAAGLSLAGKQVFIYAIIPFITLRCLEQIKVDLCVMNLPVTLIGAGAGFTYANDGPTHHAIEDVSVMRALPEMTIYNPSDAITAQHSANEAYNATGPVYVRLDKGVWPGLDRSDENLSLGSSFVRKGEELLIISTGCMTHTAVQVAEALNTSGVYPSVLDLFRLKPIPGVLAEIAKTYKRIITIEEHTLPGGMGSAVIELLYDNGLAIPMKRYGILDNYLERYGDRSWVQAHYGLSKHQINKNILEWL